ncbi:MAG: hypothetical protein FJX46_02940 [Alphaproteobacteria bacterium]|nr:hypothetical protein [Alphaproteobacteria bacterium]
MIESKDRIETLNKVGDATSLPKSSAVRGCRQMQIGIRIYRFSATAAIGLGAGCGVAEDMIDLS